MMEKRRNSSVENESSIKGKENASNGRIFFPFRAFRKETKQWTELPLLKVYQYPVVLLRHWAALLHQTGDELHKASVTERFVALRYATVLPKSASWRFVTLFGADSLSETDRCIATRQNKMAASDIGSARFKKLNVFCFFFCPWTKCIVQKWP